MSSCSFQKKPFSSFSPLYSQKPAGQPRNDRIVERSTDAALVALARQGDREAFGELVRRHYDTALRLARRMVGEPECARELVQEGALQAYLCLDRLQNDAAFSGWFCGIALNLCRSFLRNRKVEFLSWESLVGGSYYPEAAPVAWEPDPAELAEAAELHGLVLSAVGELSPKVGRAVLLFYFEQLSLREIAALLDCSVNAVKGRLHKARQELRERLWPLYAEIRPGAERRTNVTRVEIADVVEQENKNCLVTLLDRENKRCVHIMIGIFEGQCLALGLRKTSLPRPVTIQFAAHVLEALGGELEEVRIEKLVDTTFYAIARVRHGEEAVEVDARPSDAMGLAVFMGSPILVTDAVWEKAGREVTDEYMDQLGQGLKESNEKMKERMVQQITQGRFATVAEAQDEQAVLVRVELGRGRMETGKGFAVGEVHWFGMEIGKPALLYVGEEPRFVGGVVTIENQFGLKVGREVQDEDVEGYAEKNVSVEMGRGWLTAEQAGHLGVGALVQIGKMAGEPVDVLVDGTVAAWGNVVNNMEGKLGVRVTQVV